MIRRLRVAEQLRMPPPHLFLTGACDRFGVELAFLLPDHDLKREVQQQVTQLVAQRGRLAMPERLIELQGFFDQVGAQRLARLSAVPGATRAQIADERESAGESGVPGRGPLRRFLRHFVTIIRALTGRARPGMRPVKDALYAESERTPFSSYISGLSYARL